MLTATALVLLMTLPGVALFYGGLVRSRNVLSVTMQCMGIAALATVLWTAYGYSLAFGDGGWFAGGLDKAFFAGVDRSALEGTIPESVFAAFQLTFAIITPALVFGGVAERLRFSTMLWFSGLWLTLVYFPVAHWVWGGGWLAKLGVLDYAGGTVVHVNAGVAALTAALVMGRRRGFPATPMPPHNLVFTIAGACLLWVGWFGFNAGSALAANGDAGMALLTTQVAAAGSALAWMVSEWVKFGRPSALGVATGIVAGLVAITPAAGFVGPAGALIIGVAGGVACFWATFVVKRRLAIDDSLDVFSVHGIGGFVGALLTGALAGSLGGTGYSYGLNVLTQLGVQFIGVTSTVIWCALVSWLLLRVLDMALGLRVDEDQESQGLDLTEHGETGYNS
ncbi:MAG: ammonium transporter [Immundisolibacterales bacterium]|nr:ammonium transporter [Immundisolibacterales bacterium]